MTTKTFSLRSIDLIPGLGNDHDGVPFRWLASLVEKVRAQVPDDEESSCVVRGAAGLTFEYQHTLSEVEQLQATVAEMQATAEQIKAMLPIEGGVAPAVADKLRELLK
ncbi:MAG: hypothetical protein KAY54_03675 [Burkholderiaceae bacterium]|nr:hypothetical protein [Vitreoscilla sp.]MBP8100962.1 hypothetical protein [Burkholderiaceae bacterium]